jgi:hypothetical protein
MAAAAAGTAKPAAALPPGAADGDAAGGDDDADELQFVADLMADDDPHLAAILERDAPSSGSGSAAACAAAAQLALPADTSTPTCRGHAAAEAPAPPAPSDVHMPAAAVAAVKADLAGQGMGDAGGAFVPVAQMLAGSMVPQQQQAPLYPHAAATAALQQQQWHQQQQHPAMQLQGGGFTPLLLAGDGAAPGSGNSCCGSWRAEGRTGSSGNLVCAAMSAPHSQHGTQLLHTLAPGMPLPHVAAHPGRQHPQMVGAGMRYQQHEPGVMLQQHAQLLRAHEQALPAAADGGEQRKAAHVKQWWLQRMMQQQQQPQPQPQQQQGGTATAPPHQPVLLSGASAAGGLAGSAVTAALGARPWQGTPCQQPALDGSPLSSSTQHGTVAAAPLLQRQRSSAAEQVLHAAAGAGIAPQQAPAAASGTRVVSTSAEGPAAGHPGAVLHRQGSQLVGMDLSSSTSVMRTSSGKVLRCALLCWATLCHLPA